MLGLLLNRQIPRTARSSRARAMERSARAWAYSSCPAIRWRVIDCRSFFAGYILGPSTISWSAQSGSDRDLRKDLRPEMRKDTAPHRHL